MGKISFLVLMPLLALPLVPARGSSWHVDGSVSVSGDGTTWGTAFKKIQEGIDAAFDGDTIIVAEGTYVENIHFNGKNIVLRSADPVAPSVVEKTTIDGNQSGSVVTFSGSENESCILSGFTIRNGQASLYGGGVSGGTILARSRATLQNNIISGNSAPCGGGLSWCDGTIQGNTISGNSAGGGGGLAYCSGIIQNNTINGNTASGGGGLSYCQGTIQNNTISANLAEGAGGGLSDCGGTIQNNTITGNSARDGGGLSSCAGTIQDNTVTGNSAGMSGGGLSSCGGVIQDNIITMNSGVWEGGGLSWCSGVIQDNIITMNSGVSEGGGLSRCGGTIQNNTIIRNSAQSYGGGLYDCDGTVQNNKISGSSAFWGGGLSHCGGTIQNNTIVGNSAQGDGSALSDCWGAIRNCIIWNNSAPSGAQLFQCCQPTYSCVEGWGGAGGGNITEDPLLAAPEEGDCHVRRCSPCIDAGIDFYWVVWPQRDLDGNCRLSGSRCDIGCYEFGSSPDADGDLLSDADESLAGTDPDRDDSDGDGLKDGLEVLRGSDPLALTFPGVFHVPSDLPTIQNCLSLSVDGDEIVVSPGTHLEQIRFNGRNVVLRSTSPLDAGVVAETVIDGGKAGPVVSFFGTENETCVLSGFSIRNGTAENGGGISGDGTRATIQNNTICGNSAESDGGGVYRCDGAIQNNTIGANSAHGGGGLCWCQGTIQNNTVTGNSAKAWGGGLDGCRGTIQNNTITGNSAVWGGGLDSCDGTVQNNTISRNSAQLSGGGLDGCPGTIQNNVITGNSAGWYGGGLAHCPGATIQNNTITGNSAGWDGGGLAYCDGTIANCITWSNKAPTSPGLFECSQPGYSCIQDWTGGGEGNIGSDPQFVAPGRWDDHGTPDVPSDDLWVDGDYHLLPDSLCIDAGKNEDWMRRAVDLDGNRRIWRGRVSLTVDIGAYEYGSWPFNALQLIGVGSSGACLAWKSRAGDTYTVWSCDDLSTGEWIEEASVASQGESTSWTDVSAVGQRKFYQIELK